MMNLLLQFLISLMSFVTFVIDVIQYVGLRMIILFTLALTCIMFKCSIATQLPRLSYLTLVVRTIQYDTIRYGIAKRTHAKN